jgi:hypothetical protein
MDPLEAGAQHEEAQELHDNIRKVSEKGTEVPELMLKTCSATLY